MKVISGQHRSRAGVIQQDEYTKEAALTLSDWDAQLISGIRCVPRLVGRSGYWHWDGHRDGQ